MPETSPSPHSPTRTSHSCTHLLFSSVAWRKSFSFESLIPSDITLIATGSCVTKSISAQQVFLPQAIITSPQSIQDLHQLRVSAATQANIKTIPAPDISSSFFVHFGFTGVLDSMYSSMPPFASL